MRYLSLDLHGESIEKAKSLVLHYIKKAYREEYSEVRIITGRGNHPARDGQRGKLYQECEVWLNDPDLQPMLRGITSGNGHYDVKIQCRALAEQERSTADLDAFLQMPFCQDLERQAASGVAVAQTLLGTAYDRGLKGYLVDKKVALQWFEKAAKGGEPGAQLEMALRYFLGRGVRQNNQKALAYFKGVAKTSHPIAAQLAAVAKTNLGIIYCYGFGVPVDLKEGLNWLRQAAEAGYPEAMRRLAAYYYYGVDACPQDLKEGFEWYLKAAEAGDANAQYNLGIIHQSGRGGIKIDHSVAFSWFLKSAHNGDSDGMVALARSYLGGEGTSINPEEAALWLTCAEEKRHVGVYAVWATYYQMKNDLPQAIAKLEQGSAQNDLFSLCRLLVIKKLDDDAVLAKIMTYDAKEIIENAPLLLQGYIVESLLDETGKGIPSTKKNYQKAIKLLENLAKENYLPAYTKLSALYALETPLGKPNLQRSFDYAEQGRKKGNLDCCYIVMGAYLNGHLSVKKNIKKAKSYQKDLIEKKHLRFLFEKALLDFDARITNPTEQPLIIRSLREILDLAEEAEKNSATQPGFDLSFFDPCVIAKKTRETLGDVLGRVGSLELLWLLEDKATQIVTAEKLEQALLKLVESHALGCLKVREILNNFLRIENNPLFSSWKQLPMTIIQKVEEIMEEPIINELAKKVREHVFGEEPIEKYFAPITPISQNKNNENLSQGESLLDIAELPQNTEGMLSSQQKAGFPQLVEPGGIEIGFFEGAPVQDVALYTTAIQKSLVILVRGTKGIALAHLDGAFKVNQIREAFEKVGNLEEWRVAYDPHYHEGPNAPSVKEVYRKIYSSLEPIQREKLNKKLFSAKQGYVSIDWQGSISAEKPKAASIPARIVSSSSPLEEHLDLHGYSEEQAKERVLQALHRVDPERGSLRIVTGRGNHLNAQGERGTLYQRLPEWLASTEAANKIYAVQKNDGFYDINFQPGAVVLENPLLEPILQQLMKFDFDKQKALADEGDAEAQYKTGLFYKIGIKGKVNKNTKWAFQYFEKAARQGHIKSQFQVGSLYWLGDGTKTNDERAKYWLRLAAEAEDVYAAFNLAKILFQTSSEAEDWKDAVFYFEKTLDHFLAAKRFLGHAHYYGKGIVKSEERAFQLYKEASDAGDLISHYFVGQCYREGRGVRENPQKAFFYYKKGAEGGDADAQYLLAIICYEKGYGTKRDLKQARLLMEQLANVGHAGAHFYLHRLHQKLNEDISLDYLKKSAQGGFIVAQIMCFERAFVHQEKEEQQKWAKLLLARPLAHFLEIDLDIRLIAALGFELLEKENSRKEKQKSLEILEYCAKKEDVHACRDLVHLYLSGDMVNRNPEKAFYYARVGAELGNLTCLFAQFHCYKEGIGTKKNLEKAQNCLDKIESTQDPESYYDLGCDYHANFGGLSISFKLLLDYFLKAIRLLEEMKSPNDSDTKTHSDALCKIARLYLKGDRSLAKDRAQGILYLLKSVTLYGNADAVTGLKSIVGDCYKTINNQESRYQEIDAIITELQVIVDYMEAPYDSYRRRSAELNSMYGEACFGIAYAFKMISRLGKASVSKGEAYKNMYFWIEKAASLNHSGAMGFLKQLTEHYKGTPFTDLRQRNYIFAATQKSTEQPARKQELRQSLGPNPTG